MKDLPDTFELNHLIKDPTCFQNPPHALMISILTKRQRFFRVQKCLKTEISQLK